MRKLVIILIAALALAGSSAFAQDDMMAHTQWVGASTGFPLGITFHYGMEDLIGENLDLRANLSAVTFLNDAFTVAGGVDLLYQLNLETENDLPLGVYVGGGLNVGASLGTVNGVAFGVAALGGAELMVTDQIGVFGEVRGAVGLNPLFQPSIFVGVNYHF